MFRARFSHGLLFGLLLGCALLAACDMTDPNTPRERIKAVMKELSNLEYDKVVARFDPELRKSFPRERLVENWVALVKVRGRFKECLIIKTQKLNSQKPNTQKIVSMDLVNATCDFEKGSVRVRAMMNPDGTLDSLVFLQIM